MLGPYDDIYNFVREPTTSSESDTETEQDGQDVSVSTAGASGDQLGQAASIKETSTKDCGVQTGPVDLCLQDLPAWVKLLHWF